MSEKIFVTRPSMPSYEEYIEAIKPLWESQWLTNMGEYHRRLERELSEYLEVPEISLTVNGHMSLELCIQAFDFHEGGEVITTPFTFISTTHAIVRNHLKPVFCDIKENDVNMDPEKIEELITPNTVAILPTHVFGRPCDVERIDYIAKKYNLKVIYDAAHVFGVKYKGKGIGNYGDAAIFSFHATKVFNTVEGGAVVCKDHSLYEKLYDLKNFGIRNEELVSGVGANAKMNEFCAIMGLCNLKHIGEAIRRRSERKTRYYQLLKKVPGIGLFDACSDAFDNNGYMPITVEKEYPITRDELFEILRAKGIMVRKYFYPLTADHACFKNKYKNAHLEKARGLSQKVLILPLYETLELNQIDWIAEEIARALG